MDAVRVDVALTCSRWRWMFRPMAHTPPGLTRDKVYRYVRDRLLSGRPPTVREVQEAMGFGAVESARKQLEVLVAEGRLAKDPGLARGYRLPPSVEGDPVVRVPLIGEVPAGNLRTAIEDPDGYVACESRYPASELFALRVRGDRMTRAGIFAGDVVIVRRQQKVEPGRIVVAFVGDEAIVQTYRLRRGRAVLQPENPAFEPIVVDPRRVRILGRVVELRRRFG